MHPSAQFQPDPTGLLAAAERIGFAHVFATTADGPMVVHAPVTLHDGQPRFHVARSNRITAHLDGAPALLSFQAEHGYVSPNWYERPANHVPTWNYVTVEIDGVARRTGADGLIEQLDRLAALHEPHDHPWHRAKMDPAVFAGMLKGIVGFELEVTAVRGTTKLSQNKSAADRAGVVAGLNREGNAALAALMA